MLTCQPTDLELILEEIKDFKILLTLLVLAIILSLLTPAFKKLIE